MDAQRRSRHGAPGRPRGEVAAVPPRSSTPCACASPQSLPARLRMRRPRPVPHQPLRGHVEEAHLAPRRACPRPPRVRRARCQVEPLLPRPGLVSAPPAGETSTVRLSPICAGTWTHGDLPEPVGIAVSTWCQRQQRLDHRLLVWAKRLEPEDAGKHRARGDHRRRVSAGTAINRICVHRPLQAEPSCRCATRPVAFRLPVALCDRRSPFGTGRLACWFGAPRFGHEKRAASRPSISELVHRPEDLCESPPTSSDACVVPPAPRRIAGRGGPACRPFATHRAATAFRASAFRTAVLRTPTLRTAALRALRHRRLLRAVKSSPSASHPHCIRTASSSIKTPSAAVVPARAPAPAHRQSGARDMNRYLRTPSVRRGCAHPLLPLTLLVVVERTSTNPNAFHTLSNAGLSTRAGSTSQVSTTTSGTMSMSLAQHQPLLRPASVPWTRELAPADCRQTTGTRSRAVRCRIRPQIRGSPSGTA